jgi:glycosyltransferase involved in cell wall biosynthesis
MARPFVTALIDTYNHECFIEKAICSVLEQDFPASDLEILVVDDGSIDRTPEIVRGFAPRVRLLRKTNGGQASAFNAGIAEAGGELVAFLDGDDWWAPGKLRAVTHVFSREPSVGLVGHGVTQVHPDGSERAEMIRETCRFRVTSVAAAKRFRMSRGFLGTSRMTYRRGILGQIGHVPENLTFEADEYLFTLGSVLTDVVILRDSLTNYRLHGGNLFQFTDAKSEGVRKKQQVLAALAGALSEALRHHQVPRDVARTILECVEAEADVLRLMLDSGFPWETVATEIRIMRIFHHEASLAQQLFSSARLLPAFVMPAAAYYRWRSRLSGSGLYTKFRKRFFPFPVPKHVERREKPATGSHNLDAVTRRPE